MFGEVCSDLFGQLVHGRVDELFRQLLGPFLHAGRVDVEHAERGKQLGYARVVEEGLEIKTLLDHFT